MSSAARAALRARQGAGARHDAQTAPHGDLLLARRGTAYFARGLTLLRDAELDAPTRRDGWSRRRLIADVSLQAREMALALKALREPLSAEEAAWRPDPGLAASLPARALRHLFEHAAKHLDVEWRDLPAAAWEGPPMLLGAARIAPRDTPARRAATIWQAGVVLWEGGRWADVPPALRPRRPGGPPDG